MSHLQRAWRAIVAAALLAPTAAAAPPQHRQLGHALYALGFTHAAWRAEVDGRASAGFHVTPFNPHMRLDWRRYGYDCARGIVGWEILRTCPPFFGPIDVERQSVSVLVEVVRAPHNPLRMVDHRKWVPTERDLKDAALAYRLGHHRGLAYDVLILPEHARLPAPGKRSTGDIKYEIRPPIGFATAGAKSSQ
jgi:hypothetical protein